MSADYSQIEMRLMAHLSGDEALIEAFNSGEDLHRTMASMVFGTPVAEVSAEERSRIKATSYGLAYGLSSYGLAAQLGIPVPEAAALRDRYFERFGKVRDYLEGLVAPGEAAALEAIVRDKMATPVELSVPLDVAVGIGASWQLAAH